jgi:hypothetical protein
MILENRKNSDAIKEKENTAKTETFETNNLQSTTEEQTVEIDTTQSLFVQMSEETYTDEETQENKEQETVIELEEAYSDYDTPSNDSFKSYMDYRTITDKTSEQYKLQQEQAYTEWHGIRMVDDRYCVAVGSYYTTTIGQKIDVILENGNVIPCIVADLKKDIHTDSTNRQNPNGSIVEFIVDCDVLNQKIQKSGDISYFEKVFGTNLFSGEIDIIRVYED